jgi:tRNA nucleotidyltransferase (CCA-adding enzyme)
MRAVPDLKAALPAGAVALLDRVGTAASAAGMGAWLVGGLVRDLFLGVDNVDLDIAVEGDGIGFARKLAAELKGEAVEYDRFLTATLTLPDGGRMDIATARAEEYAAPAALPEVKPARMKDDLHRRDFTMNAMALSLAPAEFGALLDPFGGAGDITERAIRVIHEKSFLDDPTRMLRGARFAARFGFSLEPRTASLAREALAGGALGRLSPDRLRNELFLAFSEPDPGEAVSAMDAIGVLGKAVAGADAGGEYPEMAGALSRLGPMIEKGRGFSLLAAHLILLCRKATAEEAARTAAALNLSAAARRAFDRAPAFGELAGKLKGARTPGDVHRAGGGEPAEVLVAALVTLPTEDARKAVLDYLGRGPSSRPVLSGEDLIRMGYRPGPLLAMMLAALAQEKLDGRLADRAAEEAFIRRAFPEREGGAAGA